MSCILPSLPSTPPITHAPSQTICKDKARPERLFVGETRRRLPLRGEYAASIVNVR